jgi:hypothetical protein
MNLYILRFARVLEWKMLKICRKCGLLANVSSGDCFSHKAIQLIRISRRGRRSKAFDRLSMLVSRVTSVSVEEAWFADLMEAKRAKYLFLYYAIKFLGRSLGEVARYTGKSRTHIRNSLAYATERMRTDARLRAYFEELRIRLPLTE